MSSEWVSIGLQIAGNAVLIFAAVNRITTRLAVLETRLFYIEKARPPAMKPALAPSMEMAE